MVNYSAKNKENRGELAKVRFIITLQLVKYKHLKINRLEGYAAVKVSFLSNEYLPQGTQLESCLGHR